MGRQRSGQKSKPGQKVTGAMRIKIITDSACDMPEELRTSYDIAVVPMHIQKGDEDFLDMIEITPADVFEYGERTGRLCSTVAPNIAEFSAAFARYSGAYDAVICISIGSRFSSCYQNAAIAAEEYLNVYVIDSRNLSSGEALIVLEAARLAQSGMAAEDICTSLEKSVQHTDSSFLMSRLDYMKKGGRCTSVAALGANLLQLKPCIEVCGGEMRVWKKFRGSMEKALEPYLRERLARYDPDQPFRAILVYRPEDGFLLDGVRSALKAHGELWEASYGCTVACHCGPGTVGVMLLPV